MEENRRRTRNDPEFEILDTGIFDDKRYFDVTAEYAKGGAGRYSDPRHDGQSGPGSGGASSAADALVPQHLVVGLTMRRERQAAAGDAGTIRRRCEHETLGEY